MNDQERMAFELEKLKIQEIPLENLEVERVRNAFLIELKSAYDMPTDA